MKIAEIVQSGLCRTNALISRPKPSLFYFPGLKSQAVYSSIDFKNINDILKENFNDILNEYKQIQLQNQNDYNTKNDEHQLHSGQWNWNSYILKGKRQSEFAVYCPKTVDILENLSQPKLMTNIPFSYAFYSTLKTKSSISPHYGPCNLRIRCHFPLIIPDGDCGMKVGNEVIRWRVNEPLFFDDTYNHSGDILYTYLVRLYYLNLYFICFLIIVWNNTEHDRIILLFDIW
jgi:aspartate beta-hydroxylase